MKCTTPTPSAPKRPVTTSADPPRLFTTEKLAKAYWWATGANHISLEQAAQRMRDAIARHGEILTVEGLKTADDISAKVDEYDQGCRIKLYDLSDAEIREIEERHGTPEAEMLKIEQDRHRAKIAREGRARMIHEGRVHVARRHVVGTTRATIRGTRTRAPRTARSRHVARRACSRSSAASGDPGEPGPGDEPPGRFDYLASPPFYATCRQGADRSGPPPVYLSAPEAGRIGSVRP